MTAAYLDKQPHLLGKWSNLNPLGRIGRPDELRGVVTWLASDASTFCTGSEYVFFLPCVFLCYYFWLSLSCSLFHCVVISRAVCHMPCVICRIFFGDSVGGVLLWWTRCMVAPAWYMMAWVHDLWRQKETRTESQWGERIALD